MTKKRRTVRNIIMILMIVTLAACTWFTVDSAKESVSTSGFEMHMQGGAPSMSKSDSDSSDSESANQPPQMPGSSDNGDSNGTPPEMPNGGENGDSNGTPPEMPNGGENGDSNGTPPEMPSGEQGDSNGTPPEMPGSDNSDNSDSSDSSSSSDSDKKSFDMSKMPGASKSKSLSIWYYIAFAVESFGMAAIAVYLVMSHMNKRGARESIKGAKRILIFALATVIIASCLTVSDVAATCSTGSSHRSGFSQMMKGGDSAKSVEASGATTVDGKEETLDATYTSTKSDESAILVTNGGSATITGTVNKESGDSTNTENSEFYGVNAGVLVQADSTATIEGATITTSAKGANAVFSTGENSKIYVKNTTITTTGSSSARGLDATYGGYIEADNVTITTQGGSCAALATDRGEGTVIANNSTLTTNGKGSPVIYSTGDISIDNTKGTATGSQMVVIEGKNSATVTNSTLTASGAGNRGDVDQAGVMIYQSMSGDASEGTGTFTATDSTLSVDKNSDYYKTAPMFFITNTDAVINLTNAKLSFGSGTLISAMGTSEWGNSGSNGGNVTFNATNQTLSGNIEVDSISTAAITLKNSTYSGTINGDNSAKEISLTLDKNSTITLTGDSYVTSLDDADSTYSNINFNGYTLYVNGKAIN